MSEQAQQELRDPLWPKLQRATEGTKDYIYLSCSYYLGKTLLVCKTALKDFKSIVAVVGGPTEQERAKLVTLQSFLPIMDLFL